MDKSKRKNLLFSKVSFMYGPSYWPSVAIEHYFREYENKSENVARMISRKFKNLLSCI